MSFLTTLVPGWISNMFTTTNTTSIPQHVSDWTPPKISAMCQLNTYRRSGGVMGCKSFRWDTETLAIIVRAYQKNQLQRKLQIQMDDQDQSPIQINLTALHLEICQRVKSTIVSKAMALCKERALQCGISEREFNAVAPSIQERVVHDFDRMSHRWIRMPTIRAVQTKLGQCKYLTRESGSETSETTTSSNTVRKVSAAIRDVWDDIMN